MITPIGYYHAALKHTLDHRPAPRDQDEDHNGCGNPEECLRCIMSEALVELEELRKLTRCPYLMVLDEGGYTFKQCGLVVGHKKECES